MGRTIVTTPIHQLKALSRVAAASGSLANLGVDYE